MKAQGLLPRRTERGPVQLESEKTRGCVQWGWRGEQVSSCRASRATLWCLDFTRSAVASDEQDEEIAWKGWRVAGTGWEQAQETNCRNPGESSSGGTPTPQWATEPLSLQGAHIRGSGLSWKDNCSQCRKGFLQFISLPDSLGRKARDLPHPRSEPCRTHPEQGHKAYRHQKEAVLPYHEGCP